MVVNVPLGLIVQSFLTGMVGWFVKALLDSLASYRKESKEWRNSLDERIDGIGDATQATMRTTILHYCEKYITRGWVTSEELSSLLDMHSKYKVIKKDNGFIDGYIERVNALETREL